MTEISKEDKLLRPSEVAALFRVDPKTVTRWANQGKIKCVITPGGRRLFRESVVVEALKEEEL